MKRLFCRQLALSPFRGGWIFLICAPPYTAPNVDWSEVAPQISKSSTKARPLHTSERYSKRRPRLPNAWLLVSLTSFPKKTEVGTLLHDLRQMYTSHSLPGLATCILPFISSAIRNNASRIYPLQSKNSIVTIVALSFDAL